MLLQVFQQYYRGHYLLHYNGLILPLVCYIQPNQVRYQVRRIEKRKGSATSSDFDDVDNNAETSHTTFREPTTRRNISSDEEHCETIASIDLESTLEGSYQDIDMKYKSSQSEDDDVDNHVRETSNIIYRREESSLGRNTAADEEKDDDDSIFNPRLLGKETLNRSKSDGDDSIFNPRLLGKQTLNRSKSDGDDPIFNPRLLEKQTLNRSKSGVLKKTTVQQKKTRDRLRDICLTHGKHSQELATECENICKKLRTLKDVVDVYPAYDYDNQSTIVFVVTHTGKSIKHDIQTIFKGDEEIDCVLKSLDCFQSSNEDKSGDLRKEDEEIVRRCIRKISTELFVKHRHLSFIQGFTPAVQNKYELRLAFYVHAKGYIPIDEDPFHRQYDNIPVTVREGAFVPLSKNAKDFHKHVRMGCQIVRYNKGTLGVFFHHRMYGLCGITCAHVVLSAAEVGTCKDNNGIVRLRADIPDYIVYQPDDPHDIGRIREIIVKEEVDEKSGIEIALIQLEKRTPNSGQFPAPKQPQKFDLEFPSGKVFDQITLGNDNCWKFGSETDYTKGTIVNRSPNSCAVRLPGSSLPPVIIVLNDQILVKTLERKPFAIHGDSGSPVFVHDCDGEVVCIGIVQGGIPTSDETLVTPIGSILQAIGISRLKSFIPSNSLKCRQT